MLLIGIVLSLVFATTLLPWKFVESSDTRNITGTCNETLDSYDGNASFAYPCHVENCSLELECRSDMALIRNMTFICSNSTGKSMWVPAEMNDGKQTSFNCSKSEGVSQDHSYVITLTCERPGDLFPNGSLTLDNDGTTITYRCNDGFVLSGVAQRQCLANQTWSDQLPQCTTASVPVEKASELVNWSQKFTDKKRWEGVYEYGGQPIRFSLCANSIESNQVHAVFQDNAAEFELAGMQQNSDVMFNLSRLIRSSNSFPMNISWSVKGSLTAAGPRWTYKGSVYSSHPGFTKFTMSPSSSNDLHSADAACNENTVLGSSPEDREDDDDDDAESSPSLLAMVLGITIAFVAVLFAGFLATYCVRRNGTMRQGHQTLTSFENPIYDCENVLK